LLTTIRNRHFLSQAIHDMVILRVAMLNRAQYEFDAQVPHAKNVGLSDEQIEVLKNLTIDQIFTVQE